MSHIMRYERPDASEGDDNIGGGVTEIEVVAPSPLTVVHWDSWWGVYNKYFGPGKQPSAGAFLNASYEAALAVIENGYYIVNGERHDIKGSGKNLPAAVARWVGSEVEDYLSSDSQVPDPKDSKRPSPGMSSEMDPLHENSG